jgi:hypothetical protein
MKTTDHFKSAIKKYLDERAQKDELFAATYTKENKNIDDCISYILQTVQKSGCNGFTDEEVYSMAVHYWDEDDIKPGELPKGCSVVVNHTVELTDEEKEEARKEAIQKYQSDVLAEMKNIQMKPKTAKKKEEVQQPSLFD